MHTWLHSSTGLCRHRLCTVELGKGRQWHQGNRTQPISSPGVKPKGMGIPGLPRTVHSPNEAEPPKATSSMEGRCSQMRPGNRGKLLNVSTFSLYLNEDSLPPFRETCRKSIQSHSLSKISASHLVVGTCCNPASQGFCDFIMKIRYKTILHVEAPVRTPGWQL